MNMVDKSGNKKSSKIKKANLAGKKKNVVNKKSKSSKAREQLIAEAAYFKSLDRDYEGEDSLADWLEAEYEIDAFLETYEDISDVDE